MSPQTTASALAGLSGPEATTAWATLVERHGPDLWRLISSRSRDSHDAEDAYQEFWLGLPRAAAGFRPSSLDEERAARAWLMRVAYTSAIDHGRRRRSIQASAIATTESRNADMDAHDTRTSGSGPLGQAVADPGTPVRPGTEELADRSLLMARVQSAISSLPETYRRPLLLHLVGGLSYDDLATDLRCTVNHARVKVHRGLKRLRGILGVDPERLPDRSLAGMIIPVVGVLPTAPPLPPAVPLPMHPPTPPPGTLAAVVKTASFFGIAVMVAGGMAATALAIKAEPPSSPVRVARPVVPDEVVIPLDDFSRTDPELEGHGHLDHNSILTLAPEPTGGGHGTALRVAWPADHGIWVDASYLPHRALIPQFTRDMSGTVTLAVWSDGGGDLSYVAIRFAEANGEVFEWRRPLPEPGRSGWQTITYPLALVTPAHWDKRPFADGKIDYPLSFWGYALAFDTTKPLRAGAVLIDDVVLTLRR